MLIRVDHASTVSLAEQIAVQIRMAIVRGELQPKERLPPARDLALALKCNVHTVLRGYSRLRDDGVIQMRQGRGAWVRADVQPGLVELHALLESVVIEARKHGLSPRDVARFIERKH